MSPEVSCTCGHQWETRKPLNEIDQLRCSECGSASEDDLTVNHEMDDDSSAEEPEILESVEAEAIRNELDGRLDGLFLRMENAAPSDRVVPPEVYREYERLSELHGKIIDSDVSMSLEEVEAIEDYVDDLVDGIDEHLADIDEIASLESRVEELRNEKERLEEEIPELRDEVDHLAKKKNRLAFHVGELDEKEEAYREGYKSGRESAIITVPCSYCGEPVPIEPGSDKLESVREIIYNSYWGHPSCQERARSRGRV